MRGSRRVSRPSVVHVSQFFQLLAISFAGKILSRRTNAKSFTEARDRALNLVHDVLHDSGELNETLEVALTEGTGDVLDAAQKPRNCTLYISDEALNLGQDLGNRGSIKLAALEDIRYR